jgi:hypothetical protein
MAAPSIREQIMAALLKRAQRYMTGATRDPIRRADSALPRLVIADANETRAQPAYKKHQLALTVSVVVADAIDPAFETISHQANEHIAGVIAGIIRDDLTLGGLCDGIEYEASTINYPDPGDITFGVSLTFTVMYSVALGDPFNRS